MIQVKDVARAVTRTGSVTGRGEARSVICRGIFIVVEGSSIRATTSHTRSSHTKGAESVIVGLVIKDLSGVVVDDLPLLLAWERTAGELEHVALRFRETEKIVTLRTGGHRELSIVKTTVSHRRAITGCQRVSRAVPSVTKSVEHHKLHEGLSVGTAWENATTVVHRGIAIEVEGCSIGTSAGLSSVSEVEVHGAATLVLSDDVTSVHIDHGPGDLTEEASATGSNLEASIIRDTEGVLTKVRAASCSTISNDGEVERTGGDY